MPYDKEELFNLPVEEKLELVEALWDKIDDEFLEKKLSKNDLKKELNKRIKNIEKASRINPSVGRSKKENEKGLMKIYSLLLSHEASEEALEADLWGPRTKSRPWRKLP